MELDSPISAAPGLDAFVTSDPVGSPSMTSQRTEPRNDDSDAHWNSLVDRLIDLANYRQKVDEDDLEWPSVRALNSCSQLLQSLRREGMPLPRRIVSDGEGGISMERRDPPLAIRFEISKQGRVELLQFKDSRLVHRAIIVDVEE